MSSVPNEVVIVLQIGTVARIGAAVAAVVRRAAEQRLEGARAAHVAALVARGAQGRCLPGACPCVSFIIH